MSKREREQLPRAIPRSGADLARAAGAAKAPSVPVPLRPAPEPTAPPTPTGGYAGLIGAPSEQSPPPFEVFVIRFPDHLADS